MFSAMDDRLSRRVSATLAAALGVAEVDLVGEISQERYPGWTSLRHLALMMALEEQFGITFTVGEMTTMTSLGRIVETLRRRTNGTHAPDGDLRAKLAAFVAQTSPTTTPRAPAGGAPVIVPVGGVSAPEGLPRSLREYAQSPGQTWNKAREWLNARWQLRACDRVGRLTRVLGNVTIDNHGTMIVGNRVRIYAHYARSIFTTFAGGRLTIGDNTVVNYGADIAATGSISIGANCMIGTHVSILDNDFHEVQNRDRVPVPRPVVIQDNVWIGNRAIIMPGVTIGEGAAVGAGSVVVIDVPPRTLAMGNPARLAREF